MTGKFIKLKCQKCNNEQVIFDRAATKVTCLVCGEILAIPTGGKAELKTKAIETMK